jgi:hypothetical protein
MTARVPIEWAGAFADVPGLVFVAADVSDDWDEVAAELTTAFESCRDAAERGEAIVIVVATDDLLGRRGVGRAMVATGLLSAARTVAVETAKAGVPANVLAVDAHPDPDSIARWAVRLQEPAGPTGELIHLGPAHIGKALA